MRQRNDDRHMRKDIEILCIPQILREGFGAIKAICIFYSNGNSGGNFSSVEPDYLAVLSYWAESINNA